MPGAATVNRVPSVTSTVVLAATIGLLAACRAGDSPSSTPASAPAADVAPSDPGTPLAAPNHPMLFAYFYADGKYGDHLGAAMEHANAYVACPACYDTAADFKPSLRAALASPAVRTAPMIVIAGEPPQWDDLLDVLAPVWSRVQWVEIAHEARIRRAAMDARVRDWQARVSRRGLAKKPVGAMQDLCQTWQLIRCTLYDGWTSTLLDFVGLEAYPPVPGHDKPPTWLPAPVDYDEAHIASNLTEILTRATARIGRERQIYVAMMAYDRNGQWKGAATLPAIARATYDWAKNRPRVSALLPFAYARPGGVTSHPDLQATLRSIGAAILRRPPD